MNNKLFKSYLLSRIASKHPASQIKEKTTLKIHTTAKIIPLYKTEVVRSEPGKVVPMFT